MNDFSRHFFLVDNVQSNALDIQQNPFSLPSLCSSHSHAQNLMVALGGHLLFFSCYYIEPIGMWQYASKSFSSSYCKSLGHFPWGNTCTAFSFLY